MRFLRAKGESWSKLINPNAARVHFYYYRHSIINETRQKSKRMALKFVSSSVTFFAFCSIDSTRIRWIINYVDKKYIEKKNCGLWTEVDDNFTCGFLWGKWSAQQRATSNFITALALQKMESEHPSAAAAARQLPSKSMTITLFTSLLSLFLSFPFERTGKNRRSKGKSARSFHFFNNRRFLSLSAVRMSSAFF